MADNIQLSDDEARFLQEGGLGIDGDNEPEVEAEQEAPQTPETEIAEAPEQAAEAPETDDDAPSNEPAQRDPERNGFVPYSRFKEVNERQKAAEARLDRVLEAMNKAREAQEAPKAEAPTPPDPNEQPFEFMEYQREQLAQTNDRLSQFEQQQRQSQEAQAIQQHFVAEAQQYSAEKPDFANAYQHLHRAMVETARVAGSQNPEFEATQFELNIVRNAAMQGRNTADVLYNMAATYGYQGQQPAAPNAPAPQADASEKVQRIDNAQRRHKSLSSGGGNSAPTGITADQLLNMSDAEYHALMSNKQTRDALEAAMAAAG